MKTDKTGNCAFACGQHRSGNVCGIMSLCKRTIAVAMAAAALLIGAPAASAAILRISSTSTSAWAIITCGVAMRLAMALCWNQHLPCTMWATAWEPVYGAAPTLRAASKSSTTSLSFRQEDSHLHCAHSNQGILQPEDYRQIHTAAPCYGDV